MPRVAESVIVSYCDFCLETSSSSRAVGSCKLCGALLCRRHYVRIEFVRSIAPTKMRMGDSVLDSILMSALEMAGGSICPECANKSTLGQIVGKVDQIDATATET